jgi:outer membrane protein assembly factor BamB
MATRPRHRSRSFQNRQNKRRAQLELVPALQIPLQETPPPQEEKSVLRQLQEALWEGAAITSTLWNYRTKDWVTNVHAADIDNDGDTEVLLGSRDGVVRAHTPWGAEKWEATWNGEYISALFAIPVTDIPLYKKTAQGQPCVFVGTRDGHVYAADQNGNKIPDWEYSTGRMIRQLYVQKNHPHSIIVGSEDRCIHVLDRLTGKPKCRPYQAGGWIRCVFVGDIDNDQRDEILAGSGDKNLYILDDRGQFLDKLYLGHQIYALFAAPLTTGGPMTVITSSNRRELFVWTVQRREDGRWDQHKEWEISSESGVFDNRIHSIYVHDINNDGKAEILLGSEDGSLYILDQQGSLLWKRRFGSCIYSIQASEINFDGQIEIMVGTENNGAYVVQLTINNTAYKRIKEAMQDQQLASRNELIKILTPREWAIFKDFIDDLPPERPVQMEVEKALQLLQAGHYEQALALFLRVRQQRVQYCWAQPVTTHGYIWTLGIGQIERKGKYDLIVGTDEGYIHAIDIERGAQQHIWESPVYSRVRMLQIAPLRPGEPESIVAVLADHRLVILNNQGKIVKEHLFENTEDWVRCLHIHVYPEEQQRASQILLGLENNKILIWDGYMDRERQVIDTPQGIGILYTDQLTPTGSTQIISGTINNHIYVYDLAGKEQWSFQTQGRIHALCVEDIDRDGYAEVIAGCEDRYVYVLNHEGQLQWRYRTERGVLDVTVGDIRLHNTNENPDQRLLEVLAASADGYIYVLNAVGDLLWKYKIGSRVRAIRARDINGDSTLEIAVASQNRLDLLQILNNQQIYDYIQECWQGWIKTKDDLHSTIMELTHHSNEFMRAFALARLAGQRQRHEDDVKRFQEALRTEDSLEVKKELVRSIVLLLRLSPNQEEASLKGFTTQNEKSFSEENARQARSFLRQLSADPDPDIRLAIVSILSMVLEIDEGLCFEYLEYFTHNADMWVRRAVVRQLDELVKDHPERAFELLLTTLHDEKAWIRQETGRTLSLHFSVHPEAVIHDSIALLAAQTQLVVLEQITNSSGQPAMKRWFQCLKKLLTELNEQTIASLLDEAIEAIKDLQEFNPVYGDDFYQIYSEFRRILQIHSSSGIARYQWVNTAREETDEAYKIIITCMHIFDELQEVAETMRAYERREAVRDRVTSLLSATDKIEKIRSELQKEKDQHIEKTRGELQREMNSRAKSYVLPEIAILFILVEQVYQIIKGEISRLRGNAHLVAELRNKEAQREEEVVVSLLINNTGVSVADNIIARILEVEQDFSVIGAKEHTLLQLPNNRSDAVEFTIKPQSITPRLNFHITYDDAEKRNKEQHFADVIVLQDRQRPYIEIPNPYTSGTPIRGRDMFYGRRTDIDTLREKLSSVTGNKVVVLSGQRRMGKTSLVYQLANQLTQGPQVPVIIDLQGQAALQNMGQLFAGLARCVCDEMQRRKHIMLDQPDREAFLSNPTESFDTFLAQALQTLGNEKIVFLLDEFEVLQEKIDKGPLNQDVLHYLRSLMQHRQGLNFLLVGAPRIRHVTEPLWSVFFNITIRHDLRKLEPDEAQALITEPVSRYLEYDMLALERIHKLSGDLPYFIHILSEILIAYCNKKHKSYVTVNDINNVVDMVVEEQSSSIQWIWNQSSSPLEHFLLSVLAQDKDEDGRLFTLSDICAEFDAQGVPYEQDKVTKALQNLVREDIVTEFRNGTQYKLPIGLFKEWLRKAKPPERVIRDESVFDM